MAAISDRDCGAHALNDPFVAPLAFKVVVMNPLTGERATIDEAVQLVFSAEGWGSLFFVANGQTKALKDVLSDRVAARTDGMRIYTSVWSSRQTSWNDIEKKTSSSSGMLFCGSVITSTIMNVGR